MSAPGTPGTSLARLGVGGFTMLLSGVLLLMVGGLFATDSLLHTATAAQEANDARLSAALLRQNVQARAEGLSAFRGLLLARAPRGEALGQYDDITAVFERLHPGTVGLEVRGSDGAQVYAAGSVALLAEGPGSLPPASPNGATSIAFIPDQRVVLLRERFGSGSAAGRPLARATATTAFLLDSLVAELAHGAPSTRQQLVLVIEGDTLTWPGSRRAQAGEVRLVDVEMPGGARWQLGAVHGDEASLVRTALWMLGVLTVLLLGIGVIRERRQAIRVGQRSAELERLSSELLRANRMKSEFLANVSHELRTPLNAIVGFVELLKDGVYGELSPRQAGPVERIAVSATHLRHLVDQVLDIARLAAGRLEVHPEQVTLRTFVLNIMADLESLFSERGLAISIAVPSNLPRVRTDPAHLRQILVNLVGNAVKFTESGGVTLRGRLVGGAAAPRGAAAASDGQHADPTRPWVLLQVVDTGIGIPVADLERIFDEFEQVNAGSRGDSANRGTGLGLAISRRLARLLGGDVTVESQPGRGSTFTIWLPVEPGAVAAAAASPDGAISPA
jgi:signal transduction histidine kinase